jgi:hypothetical protein
VKAALIGVLAGAATAVILGAAQLVMWALHADFEDDPWDVAEEDA